MDETQAMPTVLKIVDQRDHPGREPALWILMSLATPSSLRALRDVDPSGLSVQAQDSVRALLEEPHLIQPASNPRVGRKEFLRVFEAAARTDWERVAKLRRMENRYSNMDELSKNLKLGMNSSISFGAASPPNGMRRRSYR